MIIRIFRGTVRPGTERMYEEHLHAVAFPIFHRQPGFLGLHYGRPTEQAPHEFLVVTAWSDIDAIKGFAGENWTRARVYPSEAEILVKSSVHHYENPGETSLPAAPGVSFAPAPPQAAVEAGPVRLALESRRAWVEEAAFELPPKEFEVLKELVLAAPRPVSSAELAARVWPASSYCTAEDVRRTVYRLRRLIGDHHRRPPLIRNRRGYGYLLDPGRAR